MKTLVFATLASTALLNISAIAGHPVVSKEVVQPVAPVYGTGFYLGLQAGANVYQDFQDRSVEFRGNDIKFEPQEKVGFVGGVKVGYVFGTGSVRPAIEGDFYYNGVEADVDATVNGHDTDFNAKAKIHSGAFLGNLLFRFGQDRFQPYLGGGVGGYYAESDDAEVTIAGRTRNFGSASNSGFAWQLIGGVDYYWNERMSTFLEYKFLNYEDAGISEDRIGQHIVVAGLRWHL